MPTTAAAALAPSRIRWTWILDRRADAAWYVGSALVGWLYLGLVLLLGRGLARPMEDAFASFTVGGHTVALTLKLLVVTSWAVLLDAPHLWATLGRTYFDPDEWKLRRGVLWKGWLFFLLGPAVVLLPYVAALLGWISPGSGALTLGRLLLFIGFQLWAYYHVVRQHWGFVALYKRKNDDSAPMENRADFWFFNLSLYLPLVLFLCAPWYGQTGLPATGIQLPLFHGWAISDVLRPICQVLYPATLLGYAAFQLARWRAGVPRNGPKLLLLAAIVPLHLAVFSHPVLALFITPIVTVGHNLQYHRIVWSYGRNKYANDASGKYAVARRLFGSVWIYAAVGLVFTFAFYRGPWVDWARRAGSEALDRALFPALGAIAQVQEPSALGLGTLVTMWFILGWAMQHYYLDSKIWRVSRDAQVAKSLNV